MEQQLLPDSIRTSIDSAKRSTVECLTGGRLPSYVRILHPATDERGSDVRWSEIALKRRILFDPAISSWCDTAGVPIGADAVIEDCRVTSPSGGLPQKIMSTLATQVINSSERTRVGYVEHRSLRVVGASHPLGSLILRGVTYSGFEAKEAPENPIFGRLDPNLWWQVDGDWLCSSDDDLACSFFAGPPEITARVLAHGSLEAAPVDPETPFYEQATCM